jgi:hypothetical protein
MASSASPVLTINIHAYSLSVWVLLFLI